MHIFTEVSRECILQSILHKQAPANQKLLFPCFYGKVPFHDNSLCTRPRTSIITKRPCNSEQFWLKKFLRKQFLVEICSKYEILLRFCPNVHLTAFSFSFVFRVGRGELVICSNNYIHPRPPGIGGSVPGEGATKHSAVAGVGGEGSLKKNKMLSQSPPVPRVN